MPSIPQSRERKRLPGIELDVDRSLAAILLLPPFVKPIGDNKASTLSKGFSECPFLRKRFRSGVDHPAPDPWVLRPLRDEPPACLRDFSRPVTPDDQNVECGSNVVARLDIRKDETFEGEL
tara:strand:+ start:1072 stop:1434 length:363 start_codon:yes stop_codon:yes gene_type:complete